MNLFQIIKMSLQEIKDNKLRSFLTILGTAIGTASIILFVTISIGSRAKMYEEMSLSSPELIKVNIFQYDDNKTITYDESKKLLNTEYIDSISPVISGNSNISYGKNIKENASLVGIDENYSKFSNTKIKSGRDITSIDIDNYKKVVVLGSTIAKELFKDEDAVGNYVNINKVPYKVIGVLEPISTTYSSYEDLNVYIPRVTMMNVSDSKNINTLYVKAKSKDDLSLAQMDLESFLVKELGGRDSYMLESSKDLETMKSMDKILDILIGAIAGISLVVSGIGIMNMMLVSVMERTKEIGIRKALGAKRKSILTQFLIESLVVSLIGGILGSLIGIFGSNGVLSIMGAKPYIAWNVIIIAMIFVIAVGVIFGIIPANKASKLNPIEALRTE